MTSSTPGTGPDECQRLRHVYFAQCLLYLIYLGPGAALTTVFPSRFNIVGFLCSSLQNRLAKRRLLSLTAE
jgi:hypothetical protein